MDSLGILGDSFRDSLGVPTVGFSIDSLGIPKGFLGFPTVGIPRDS